MWLAPNLVTLLGFMFILGNVALLEVYVPDLVGPVSNRPLILKTTMANCTLNVGSVMGVLQLRLWIVDVRLYGFRR